MQWHDVALALIAFIAEVLGTISGFGSSTFFVPSAVFLEGFHLVLVLTAILHVMSNTTRLFLFRRELSIKDYLPLAIPSIAFTALGAVLTAYLPIHTLKVALGLALIVISLTHYLFNYRAPKSMGIILTSLSGFFTGLVGTGGAIRAAALSSMKLEKSAFIFASTVIDFGGDVVRAGIYLNFGYMDWAQWYYLPLLAVAAFFGAKYGKWLLSKLQQSTFERIVTALVLLSGISLIMEGI
jgi:uncharacterized membrane protein YfcA